MCFKNKSWNQSQKVHSCQKFWIWSGLDFGSCHTLDFGKDDGFPYLGVIVARASSGGIGVVCEGIFDI